MTEALLEAFRSNTSRYAGGGGFDLAQIQRLQLQPVDLDLNNDNIHALASGGNGTAASGDTVKSLGLTAKAPEAPVQQVGETANLEFSVIVDRVVQEIQNLPGYSLHEKQNFMSDFYENVWVPYHRRRRNRTLRKTGITTDDLLKRALQIRRDLVLHYRKKEEDMNRNGVFEPEQNATRMENALRVDLRRRMRLDRLVQDITDAHKNGRGADDEEISARKRKDEEEKGHNGNLESALDDLIPIDADGNFTQVSDQRLHQSRGRRPSRQLHVPQPEDVYGPLSARGRRRSIAEAFSRGGSPVDGDGDFAVPPQAFSRRTSRASSYQGSDIEGSDLHRGSSGQYLKSGGAGAGAATTATTDRQTTLSPNSAHDHMTTIGEDTAATNTQLNLGIHQPITIAIGGPDGGGTRPLKESRDQRRARLGIGAPQSAREHGEGHHARTADFTGRDPPKTARGDLERGSMGRDRTGYHARGKDRHSRHRARKPKLSAVGEIAKEASQLLHDLAAKAKKRVLGLEPFSSEDARLMHDRLKGTKSPFSDTIRTYLSSAVASPDSSKDAFAQEILDPRMQLHTKNVAKEAEEMEANDPGSMGAEFAPFDKDPLLSARVTARVLPRRDRDDNANVGTHLHRYLPSTTEVAKDVLDNNPVPQEVQDLATSAIEDDLEGGVPKLTFYPRFQTLEGFGKLMLRSAGSRLSSRRPEDISLQSQSRPVGALNDQNVAFNGGVIDMDDHLLRMGVGSGRAQDRNLVQLFTELFDQDTAYMMHDQSVQEYIDKRGDKRKINLSVDVGGDGAGDHGSPRTPRTPRGTAIAKQKSKGSGDDDDDEDASLAKRQIKKLVELRNEVKNEQQPTHEGDEGSTDGPDLLGSSASLETQPLFSHLTPSRLTAKQDGALTKLRHRGVTDGNDLRFEETISGAKVDNAAATPAGAEPSKPRFDFDMFGAIVDDSNTLDMRLEALSDDEQIEVTENFQSVVAASRGAIPRSSSYTDMTTFLQGKDQIITTETATDASTKGKISEAQAGEVLTASSVPYNYEDEVKKANKVVATRQARLADGSGLLGLNDTAGEDTSNILTEDQAEEVMQAELQKMLAGEEGGSGGKQPHPLSRKTGASTSSSKSIARPSQVEEKPSGEGLGDGVDARPQSSGKGVTFAGVDHFAAAREAGEPAAVHRRRSPTPPDGATRGGDPLAEAPTTVVKRAFQPKRFKDYVSEFDKMEEVGSDDGSRAASAAHAVTSEEELHTASALAESEVDAGASSRPDSLVYGSRMTTPGGATDSLAGDGFSRPSTRPSSIVAAEYDGSRQASPMSEYFMHPLTPSTAGSRSLASTPVLEGTALARPTSTQQAARSALSQVRASQHDFVTLSDAERISQLPHRNSRASYQATNNDGADPNVDRRGDSPLVIHPIRGQPAPPNTPPRTPLSRRPASRPSRQGTPGGKPPTASQAGTRSTFVPRFATKDQPTNVEGADGDGDRKDFVPLQSKHQQLLERLWNTARMPVYQKVDMMVKYTTESYAKKIDAALQQWDLCIKLAQDRERALEALQDFEWIASDPRRYFTESSVNRLVEAKERSRLTAVLNKLTPRCKKAILELKKNFGDNFTFDGRPYLDKMRTDQVELLYDVSSARTEDETMHGMSARDPLPPKSDGGYLRPSTASSAVYGNTLAIGQPPPSPSQHAPRPPAGSQKSTRRQRRRKHKEKKKASAALYSSLQQASRVQTKWEGVAPP